MRARLLIENKNIDVIAGWLGAHTYQTFYRPVPVQEHLVYESNIYPASTVGSLRTTAAQTGSESRPLPSTATPIRTIQSSPFKELKDTVLNSVVALANETVRSGYGALIFCSSRFGCESDARLIARVLPGLDEMDAATAEKRSNLLADLQSLPSGLDPGLAETVPLGVAFHRVSSLIFARRCRD